MLAASFMTYVKQQCTESLTVGRCRFAQQSIGGTCEAVLIRWSLWQWLTLPLPEAGGRSHLSVLYLPAWLRLLLSTADNGEVWSKVDAGIPVERDLLSRSALLVVKKAWMGLSAYRAHDEHGRQAARAHCIMEAGLARAVAGMYISAMLQEQLNQGFPAGAHS